MDQTSKKKQKLKKNSEELGVVVVKPKLSEIGSRLSRKFSGGKFDSVDNTSSNKTQRSEVWTLISTEK